MVGRAGRKENPLKVVSDNLTESATAGHTILVVDDEPTNLHILSKYLRDAGFTILVSRDGESALKRARYTQPDLILLDVMMPGIDGFETCRRLKADEALRPIPVIFMSALITTAAKVKGFKLGAVDYIPKPFQHEEVLGRVTTHLHLRDLTRELQEAKQRLERRVEERTAELAQAIEELQAEITKRVRTEKLLYRINRTHQALGECNRALLRATEETEFVQEVCRIIVQNSDYPLVWIGFVEQDEAKTLRLVAQAGPETGNPGTASKTLADITLGHGPAGTAIRTGKPAIRRDILATPDYASSAALPLLTGAGKVLGALNIYAIQADAFAAEEIDLLMHLTGDLAHGIVTLRTQVGRQQADRDLRRYAERLEGLRQVGLELAVQLDLNTLLRSIVSKAVELMGGTSGGLYLYHADRDVLELMVVVGLEQTIVGDIVRPGEGVGGKVWQSGEPLVINDYRHWAGRVAAYDSLGLWAVLGVPIRWGARRLGVSVVSTRDPHVFTPSDIQVLSLFSTHAAIAIENARLFEAEREQRRQAEQSRDQLVRSEKLAATGRLAASLAHEINNPLQIIHNSLQMMLNLPFGPDKQQEYLRMANGEVERLMGIVTRILDFARPAAQKRQLTDVNDVVEKALALTGKYLQHNQIVLERSLSASLPPVAAVPDELGQVFLNLVLNAVDAMPHGGTLRVSSRLDSDGYLAVAFADTGQGISPELMERLFEPFFSTKEGGSGLGLSISHEVVEQHEGEITVASAADEGTTFTVRLPAMVT